MPTITKLNRPRGIVAAHASADARAAFAELRAAVEGRLRDIDELRAEQDDLSGRLAALTVGGAAGSAETIERPGQRREINAALRDYLRTEDSRALAILQPRAGMSSDDGPGGGYSVVPTLSPLIAERLLEVSPMRRLARNETVEQGGDFEELVTTEEAEAGWVGERDARPETAAPKLSKITITLHEIYANPAITQRLLDDSSFDLAAWIAMHVAQRFARVEGSAFISGDGVEKPRGLLAYDTVADVSYAWGKLGYVASGVAGALTDGTHNGADALVDLVSALPSGYRSGATFLMNRKTAGEVRKLKDDQGRFLWVDSLAAGQPDRLLGFPAELDENMPDVGANAFPMAFGNFGRGYTIATRPGLRLLRDPYTSKPNVQFYTYARVGGGVTDFDAIKLLKIAAS